jgi:hypothetical protein
MLLPHVSDVSKVAVQLKVGERRIHDIIHGRSNFDPWLIGVMTEEFGLDQIKVADLMAVIHQPRRVVTVPQQVPRPPALQARRRRAFYASA